MFFYDNQMTGFKFFHCLCFYSHCYDAAHVKTDIRLLLTVLYILYLDLLFTIK